MTELKPFKPFKIVTQTDRVEAGGMMDDCAWASLAGIANHLTGSKLDCGDGIAIGEKVGRHDRDGKGDGSSLAQMKKGGELVGLKGRYPKSWDEVVAALADSSCALAVSVQQPIGYPEAVMPISKWHTNVWAPWAKKTDPKGYKAGYGHLTAAAGYHQPFGAQWACPTRSGKGVEALAQPLTVDEFKMIASSHGDAPHKRVLIFTAANAPNKKAETVGTVTPKVVARVAPKNPRQVAPERVIVADDGKVDTAKMLTGALNVVKEIREGNASMKEQVTAALLDALTAAISTAIAVFLGLGISIFDLTGEGAKAVVASAVGAGLMVLQKWLDEDNTKYGRNRN